MDSPKGAGDNKLFAYMAAALSVMNCYRGALRAWVKGKVWNDRDEELRSASDVLSSLTGDTPEYRKFASAIADDFKVSGIVECISGHRAAEILAFELLRVVGPLKGRPPDPMTFARLAKWDAPLGRRLLRERQYIIEEESVLAALIDSVMPITVTRDCDLASLLRLLLDQQIRYEDAEDKELQENPAGPRRTIQGEVRDRELVKRVKANRPWATPWRLAMERWAKRTGRLKDEESLRTYLPAIRLGELAGSDVVSPDVARCIAKLNAGTFANDLIDELCEIFPDHVSVIDGKVPNKKKPERASDLQELLAWVKKDLKGKQRRVMELLIQNGCRYPIADLAFDEQIDWQTPYDNAWNSIKKVLNRKLHKAKLWYRLSQHSNDALLSKIGQK